jgi:hypothetical protein
MEFVGRQGSALKCSSASFRRCDGCTVEGNGNVFHRCEGCVVIGDDNTLQECTGCTVVGKRNVTFECSGMVIQENSSGSASRNKVHVQSGVGSQSGGRIVNSFGDDDGFVTTVISSAPGGVARNDGVVNIGSFSDIGRVAARVGRGVGSQTSAGVIVNRFGGGAGGTTTTFSSAPGGVAHNRGTVTIVPASSSSSAPPMTTTVMDNSPGSHHIISHSGSGMQNVVFGGSTIITSSAPLTPRPRKSRAAARHNPLDVTGDDVGVGTVPTTPAATAERGKKEKEKTAEKNIPGAPDAVADEEKTADSQKQCAVCLDRLRSVVAVPCGHLRLCVACAREHVAKNGERASCVVCRQTVTAFNRVFM